jgi:hypothetical protein
MIPEWIHWCATPLRNAVVLAIEGTAAVGVLRVYLTAVPAGDTLLRMSSLVKFLGRIPQRAGELLLGVVAAIIINKVIDAVQRWTARAIVRLVYPLPQLNIRIDHTTRFIRRTSIRIHSERVTDKLNA